MRQGRELTAIGLRDFLTECIEKYPKCSDEYIMLVNEHYGIYGYLSIPESGVTEDDKVYFKEIHGVFE